MGPNIFAMKKLLVVVIFILNCNIIVAQQHPFTPEAADKLKTWIKEAKKANELNKEKLTRLWEIHTDLKEGSTDANHIYNYGRAIADAIQPVFSLQGHTNTQGVIQLMVQAELAYRYAITNCECHGRANIMLGMLYNQEKKYFISEPYLEKGLQLKEGSNDWMIAANQYILAGAYTYSTKKEKYQKVYQLFKKYAPNHGDPYYIKMAAMYVPYYED